MGGGLLVRLGFLVETKSPFKMFYMLLYIYSFMIFFGLKICFSIVFRFLCCGGDSSCYMIGIPNFFPLNIGGGGIQLGEFNIRVEFRLSI